MNKSTKLARLLKIPNKPDIKFAKRLLIIFICAALAAAITAGGLFGYRYFWGDTHAKNPEREAVPLTGADFLSPGESGKITLTAMGGLSLDAPENSVPAFDAAAQAGYKSVLLFVRETKDGMAVVVTHEDAGKITGLEGALSEITFSQLMSAPIDSGANIEKFGELRVLTLSEAIQSCYNRGLYVIAEFDTLSDSCISQTVQFIQSGQLYSFCTLASQDGAALKKIYKLDKQITLCYRVSELSGDFKVFLNRYKISTIMFAPQLENVNASKISEFIKEDYEIICSDVNDLDSLKTMYRYGVRHFVTECILPHGASEETSMAENSGDS